MNTAKKVPIREGLWNAEEPPRLLGSQCNQCGEVLFPKRDGRLCSYCQSDNLKEVVLSRRGKIYSNTVVMQRPPVYYLGEVPYALGFVELPEGVRIETLFTGCNPDDLHIGMDVEVVIEKLNDDEQGNEVMAYKFRPVVP